MSTDSAISVKTSDGKFLSTKVNWDGYLGHVGKILQEHYTETEKVFDLINGGEIRSFEKDGSVEYYDETDYYPVIDKAPLNDGYYSYTFYPMNNKWFVTFTLDGEELKMDLETALREYPNEQ